MELRPGLRLASAVCDTEVVVVRAPKEPAEVACGGAPMIEAGAARPAGNAIASELSDGSLLGKRYADEGRGIELLVTKAGQGTLTVDGAVLGVKDPKPLPSSD